MNFVKLYIGDYLRDTGTLTIAEHGAYVLMLLHHYAIEMGLPHGKELHRLLRAESKADREAIDSICAKFWYAGADGKLFNKRADMEILKAEHQRDVNRIVGKLGGRPKRIESETLTDSKPNRLAIGTEPEPNPNPNHSQTPDNQEVKVKTQTARKRAAPAVLVCVDDMVAEGVVAQHASDWLLNRKTKGLAPLTLTIWDGTKAEAAKAGLSVAAAIKTAAGAGWGGFMARWLTQDSRNGSPMHALDMDGVY